MTDYNDLEITTHLDSSIPLDAEPVLTGVDNIIARSIAEKNPYIAFRGASSFIQAQRLSGLGLTKLLYNMQSRWNEYNVPDNFFDMAYEEIGLSRITIERYIRIWEMFENGNVPENVIPELQQHPLKDLSAIATAVESGYKPNDKQWAQLASAETNGTVLNTIRDVKGVHPRSNSLQIKLERDGSLRGYKEKRTFFIGYLNVDEAQDDDDVEKAINRIVNGCGIIKE